MENPITKMVKKRKGLKKIHEDLATAQQIGIDLKGLAAELDMKEQLLIASEKKYRDLAMLTENVVDNVPGYI